MTQLDRLNVYISMKTVFGLIYLKAAIERIEISKKLLVLDIERGNEVLIPHYLS